MLIAYQISPHDDGTHMLGRETFRPPPSAGYYDWRFGKDGVPHPATCETCGRKTDANYVHPKFRAKKRTWDISSTYDGYCIVSSRFRQFCEQQGWRGMQFVTLPSDNDFFVLRISKTLTFDAERRETRFEDPCPTCKSYFNVIGANPAYLHGIKSPIKEGFFRSDLEFGSGHEQHPLILIGVETAKKLKDQGFRNYDLHAVTT